MNTEARPRVAVVDYGMGNRRSVEKALIHVGAAATITDDPEILGAADALVLPGVGAFPKGMANLQTRGLDELLRERVSAGVPLLGICLGMQLLFDSSAEQGRCLGLGLVPGKVLALKAQDERIPHIGWTEVDFIRGSELTASFQQRARPFYHVHSFVAHPDDPSDVIGVSEYGETFATCVSRGNVYGTQFHPEKSSLDGLTLLRSFLTIAVRPRTLPS